MKRHLWIVPRLRDERMYNLTSEYLAAMWKATGADMPAAAMSATQPNVHVYRFDWNEEPTILGAERRHPGRRAPAALAERSADSPTSSTPRAATLPHSRSTSTRGSEESGWPDIRD